MKLIQDILGGFVKSNLPALISELKKELPTLAKEYLPKLLAEHKEKLPEYVEKIRLWALAELQEFDFDDNDIADVDEYKDEIDEIAGHFHAVTAVAAKMYARAQLTKSKVLPGGVKDAKNSP